MIQCFNYIFLKISVHNCMLLTMLCKGLAVWAHNVVSWASDAPTQLIHHSPSPHLWPRPQITSSYHLLTNQDEAVLWNKIKVLDESFKYESLFHFRITSTKKIYFDCKMWPLLFYRTEHLSKSQGGFTRLQFQKSLHKVSFVSTSPLQHLTNDKKDIILLSVSDVHTCMCRHG